MLDCLIIGDSIAVGTKMFRPECAEYAKGGITSNGWDKLYGNKNLTAESVIISLGTNDWEKYNTFDKLESIRMKITGKRVFWILPNQESKPQVYYYVKQVAKQFGDTTLETTRWQADKIHPSWVGYKSIAERTK